MLFKRYDLVEGACRDWYDTAIIVNIDEYDLKDKDFYLEVKKRKIVLSPIKKKS